MACAVSSCTRTKRGRNCGGLWVMHEIRHPSQHLSWLSRLDKWLPFPRLVFADLGDGCGGHYQCPWKWEHWYDGTPINSKRGIIAVNTRCDESEFAATLAHEWRHHWQWLSGWKNDSPQFVCANDADYDSAIRTFFSASQSERDALRFQEQVAPTGYAAEWQSLCGLYIPSKLFSFGGLHG